MLLNAMFRKLSFNFRKVIFTSFVLSLSVILFSGQTMLMSQSVTDDSKLQISANASACPYTSVQARVQPNVQTPWTQELTINKGEQVRVGGFKNGSGYLADCCVSLTVTGPNGYVSYPANASYITLPYSGNYTLKVTCDTLQDTAIIHVIGCPYSSIQARVQPNVQTPWTQELTINKGEQVRVGGFKNGSGYLADCCVSLQVTGPNGYVSNPANGSYITLQYPGNYTLKVTCDTLQDTAIIHVLACPYSSVQARVQPNVQTPWTQELTINKGEQVRVGGFKNGSGELADCCVSLQVTGPNGYVSNPANGTYITLQSSGDYTLKVTCGNLQDTAIIHVNECPYSSVQARVQPNVQTPWTQELTINKGDQVRVGGFKNGSGYLADCCVDLTVTGPNGYVSNPANGSYITLQHSGDYTLKVTCGSLQDSALIHVLDNAACPFNSVQARVQRDIAYDWKKELKINFGEQFRVGAFKNNSGILAECCVIITLFGPNNYVTSPQNGTYVTPPYKGIYVLKVSCGNLIDSAIIYVNEKTCQCSPIRAKVQAIGSNKWKENLTIKKGQSFRVGALKNNQLAPANCSVCLLVKGSKGYISYPANGSYITPTYAGKYDLHVNCGKSSNNAHVNVTITQEEGDDIHITQYGNNCGPASLAMCLRVLGYLGYGNTQGNFTNNEQIRHARALIKNTSSSSILRNNITYSQLDTNDYTCVDQNSINEIGGFGIIVNSQHDLDFYLENGMPVAIYGEISDIWEDKFTNSGADDDYNGWDPSDPGHYIAVTGRSGNNYIVNDPLHVGGALLMSWRDLLDFRRIPYGECVHTGWGVAIFWHTPTPFTITRNNGRTYVFMRNKNDDRIYFTYRDFSQSNVWQTWSSINSSRPIWGNPVAIETGYGSLHVFAIGENGQILSFREEINGNNITFVEYNTNGGISYLPLTVCRNYLGYFRLFARGIDGNDIWQYSLAGWRRVNGDSGDARTGPSAVLNNADCITVFAGWNSNTSTPLYFTYETAPYGNWSGWAKISNIDSGSIKGSPVAFRRGEGVTNSGNDSQIRVFVRARDTSYIYYKNQANWNDDWRIAGQTSMVAFGQPAVGMMNNGTISEISVFVRNVNNRIQWTFNLNDNNWDVWQQLGNGITTSNIAVCRISDGRILVVVKGTDNRMYYNLQTGLPGTWSGWAVLGNAILF